MTLSTNARNTIGQRPTITIPKTADTLTATYTLPDGSVLPPEAVELREAIAETDKQAAVPERWEIQLPVLFDPGTHTVDVEQGDETETFEIEVEPVETTKRRRQVRSVIAGLGKAGA